ncbi:hypothetical protein SSX86_009577 [Deinandra increscens subsp. villosa]|uniref:Uncharacterized protein n=1 Tax=Deinandra increscens subsp. villosa TaxID=3103831 RepID=A0AAP0H370_9ASTR
MERSEPTFVPGWLKSTTSHQLHSDEQGVSKATRNKSLDNELGRPLVSERTTSSYFRRASSSNGSPYLRSYGSFDRYSDKEKSENRLRDCSDPLGSILPSRFEKDGLRRSNSSVSTKRGESWPRKLVADSTTSINKSYKTSHSHNNGGALRSGVKIAFERDFPSLGAEERQKDPEIGRVSSPGLSSAIQSLPNSAGIGGDGWTSALAEVPVVQSTPISATTSMTTGRNMAETLAQGPPRAQTAPQLLAGTQRLEELAVKQSRQLIPVTPSMPKALALNSSDKPKPKVAQIQLQSSHLLNSSRPVSTMSDSIKTSTVGKLHVLKPSRERNGATPIATDNLRPTAAGKLPNSPLAAPSIAGPVPPERKPVGTTLEKRPSSQAQSRNDFFNLMRKKSMTPIAPDNSGSSISAIDKPGEAVTEARCGVVQQSNSEDDLACNGDADVATESSSDNGKDNSNSDAILYSEEEEARFLRSLGWEETADEEGLTEEEINSFYRDANKYLNLQAASKIFKGTQPKLLGEVSLDSKLKS